MAYLAEAHRPSLEPVPSRGAQSRGKRWVMHPARLAAILLLLVWVGPVTFAQTDSWQLLRVVGAPGSASADSQVIPAGRALVLEVGTSLKLRLRDGRIIMGRYLGRTLLDSTLYAPRFAEYARTSSYVPFALGETLHVSLRDGREWTAPFVGYAELTLLLQSDDGAEPLRVPFDQASEIRRAPGDQVEPIALIRAFHDDLLPSAEALVVGTHWHQGHVGDPWAGALRVPAQDIEAATLEIPRAPSSKGVSGGEVVGIVLLSVAVSLVLFAVIVSHSINSAAKSCGSYPLGSAAMVPAGMRLTTRPFDRHRGCYVGDDLAVDDPGSGSIERDVASPAAVTGPVSGGSARDDASCAGPRDPRERIGR